MLAGGVPAGVPTGVVPAGAPPVGGAEPSGGVGVGVAEGLLLESLPPPPQPARSAAATSVAQRDRPKTPAVVLLPLIVLLL
jgi:hypothetical protein